MKSSFLKQPIKKNLNEKSSSKYIPLKYFQPDFSLNNHLETGLFHFNHLEC